MNRSIALFSLSFLALFLTGCPDGGGTVTTPPPPVPLDPGYVACISTAPVDPGNPSQPVITLIGFGAVDQPLGSVYVDAGATATDPLDGDISNKITVTGLANVNTNAVGDYMIRYNVVDSANLWAAEVVRMIRVTDGTFTRQTARDMGTTGAHMAFYEHLPVNYTAGVTETFPLIVFQHGYGGARFTADGTAEQAPLSILQGGDMVGLIDQGHWDDSRPFIVLSPQRCVDPLTFVVTANQMRLFIDYALHAYKVDPSRIYMSGYSQGSGDTWDYVNNYPNQLAAVVPMSGDYGTSVGCVLKETPAWAFNGDADTIVPYLKQVATVNSINACNPVERARITVFPGVTHDGNEGDLVLNLTGLGQGIAPYDIYDENIYDWLLAHRRTTIAGVSVSGEAAAIAAPLSAPDIPLAVAPDTIVMGGSVTLRWSVTGAATCAASGDWVGPRPASGTESVKPVAPGIYNYILSCSGPGGDVAQSVSLTVRAVDDMAPRLAQVPGSVK